VNLLMMITSDEYFVLQPKVVEGALAELVALLLGEALEVCVDIEADKSFALQSTC